jgi:hypothetical protein
MVEPLTKFASNPNFTGKTYNTHPHWYNEPLRLTKEQKKDPLPVLDDFFECYHLNEVRQTFWEWLTEVLSSPRSIAIEPLERNNHIYFYEKIEGVIEAAFVIRKKMHKHRRRWEKRKLKKGTHSEKDQVVSKKVNFNSATLTRAVETDDNVDIFNKPKQLIEYVDDDPLYVIEEVFNTDSLVNLCDEIRAWYDLAMLADSGIYEEADQRRQLHLFHGQLQMLVEALFIISRHNKIADIKEIINEADKPKQLSKDQIANPKHVIFAFFEKFPRVYITRELDDWLNAGICYSGPLPDNMCEVQVLEISRNVLCLIKSAERLLTR